LIKMYLTLKKLKPRVKRAVDRLVEEDLDKFLLSKGYIILSYEVREVD